MDMRVGGSSVCGKCLQIVIYCTSPQPKLHTSHIIFLGDSDRELQAPVTKLLTLDCIIEKYC